MSAKGGALPMNRFYPDRSGAGRDQQMRQGQQNKRMRGRNRKGPNTLTRSFESNGPDVKIRGTALHIAEKYVQLARDAQSSGDRVAGENYLQHAEHYYRIVAAAQAQSPQQQQQQVYRSDEEGEDDEEGGGDPRFADRPQFRHGGQPVSYGGNEPQPYVNGAGPDSGGDEEPAQAHVPQPAQPPVEDARGEARPQQDGGGGTGPGGSYRSRRRRPYRERNGEQASGAAASPQVQADDDPPGDD
jgi:hypothetical protein